jgi:hypothetical protein
MTEIAVHHEIPQTLTYQVREYPLPDEDLQRIVDLRLKAFGFPVEYRETQFQEVQKYNSPGTYSIACMDSMGKLAGELTALTLESIFRGKLRLNTLTHLSSNRWISNLLSRVVAVYSITTDPETQNQGIGKKLLNMTVEKFHPVAIIGISKTPALVFSWAQGVPQDYVTYYGKNEVQVDARKGGNLQSRRKANTIQSLYAWTKHTEGQFFFEEPTTLPTYVPNTSGFPEKIQAVFDDVIAKQNEIGERNAVGKCIISVKR